jgi:hypothetical protein
MFPLGHLGLAAGAALLLARREDAVDLRFVLFGALLPDLVDKPLGALLGLESRLWAHTALFALALAAATLLAVGRHRALPWLAFGGGVHLVLDRMWEMPNVLAWPAFGVAFPPGVLDVFELLRILVAEPYVYGGEVVGGLVLVAVAWRYGVRGFRDLARVLRTGRPVA